MNYKINQTVAFSQKIPKILSFHHIINSFSFSP